MMSRSRFQFNSQITTVNNHAFNKSDSGWYQPHLAKESIALLKLCQFVRRLLRLQTYPAIIVRDDRSAMLARDVGITPGVIPIGMAIDANYYASRQFACHTAHHCGH